MTIAATANDSQVFPYSPNDVFKCAMLIVVQNGWDIRFSDPLLGRISARAKMGLKSAGENIVILVTPSGGGTEVRIESTCNSQIMDWGKNKQNVDRIIMGLATQLQATAKPTLAGAEVKGSPAEAPQITYCPNCGAKAAAGNMYCSKCGKSLA
jgi:hypothetical protein